MQPGSDADLLVHISRRVQTYRVTRNTLWNRVEQFNAHFLSHLEHNDITTLCPNRRLLPKLQPTDAVCRRDARSGGYY